MSISVKTNGKEVNFVQRTDALPRRIRTLCAAILNESDKADAADVVTTKAIVDELVVFLTP